MVVFLLKLTCLVTLISHSENWMFSVCFCHAMLMVHQEPEDQVEVKYASSAGVDKRMNSTKEPTELKSIKAASKKQEGCATCFLSVYWKVYGNC